MKWFGPPALFLTALLLFAKCDNKADRYAQAGWGDPVRQLDSTDKHYATHCENIAWIISRLGGDGDGQRAIHRYLDVTGAALLSQHAEKPSR